MAKPKLTQEEFESIIKDLPDKVTEKQVQHAIKNFLFKNDYKATLEEKIEGIKKYFKNDCSVDNSQKAIKVIAWKESFDSKDFAMIGSLLSFFDWLIVPASDEKIALIFIENLAHKEILRDIITSQKL